MPKTPPLDLTGQRYGRLVAVRCVGSLTKSKAVGRGWLWRCDCGTEFVDHAKTIREGRKVSCGCRQRETQQSNVRPETLESAALRRLDLTGQRFGRLVVLSHAGSSQGGVLWRCRCDCGAEIVENRHHLTAGNRISCGCAQREAGLRNLAVARERRQFLYRARNSRLLAGLVHIPSIRRRRPRVVHRLDRGE